MSDPSLALQGALVTRLNNSPDLQALIGQRVYDETPPTPVFPYVTLGDGQVLRDEADCVDGSECFLNVHVWSRSGKGFVETKRIVDVVRASLHAAELGLGEHRLVDLMFESVQYIHDPDGLTRHAAMTFRALTEPA